VSENHQKTTLLKEEEGKRRSKMKKEKS